MVSSLGNTLPITESENGSRKDKSKGGGLGRRITTRKRATQADKIWLTGLESGVRTEDSWPLWNGGKRQSREGMKKGSESNKYWHPKHIAGVWGVKETLDWESLGKKVQIVRSEGNSWIDSVAACWKIDICGAAQRLGAGAKGRQAHRLQPDSQSEERALFSYW